MPYSHEFLFYTQTQESPNYTDIPTGTLAVQQLIKGNSAFWINSESAVKKPKKLIINLTFRTKPYKILELKSIKFLSQ